MSVKNEQHEANGFRPVPFYFINRIEPDDISRQAIFSAMEQLKAQGFGGVVVFNKPPDGFSSEEYLTEPWFDVVGYFAEAGRTLNLQIWINDGFDFPPGNAGGRIEKIAPQLKQRRFQRLASGKIVISEVDWGFPAFEEPESSELFIKLVYEPYKERFAEYFGNGITGIFSDADCRRFGHFAEAGMKGERYFPTSINFLSIFKADYGYELEPHLDAILDGNGGQVAADYWELAEKLYAKWFENNHNWCRENGLKYTFHSSDTGPFAFEDCARSSIFLEGRYERLAKCCDYPGTDHELMEINGGKHFGSSSGFFNPSAIWGGADSTVANPEFSKTFGDLRAKYAASVGFLYRRERVLCEAFAATNWGCTHQDLRRIAAWQMMQGINFFVPHAFHHRLQGETKYFAPPDFSECGSLQHGLREFNDWLAFICMNATQGEPVMPIAVLDTAHAVWLGEDVDEELFTLCETLNRLPYGYIIADETALLAEASRFKAVINPGIKLTDDFCQTMQQQNVTIIDSKELKRLPELLGQDIVFSGTADLHYMRRKLDDGREFCLVANIEHDQTVSGSLQFKFLSRDIELEPGEIAIVGEVNECFRSPAKSASDKILLPEEYQVEWEQENIIPLSRWENAAGAVVALSGVSQEPLCFKWSNSETVEPIYLLVPENLLQQGVAVKLDGLQITGGIATQLWHDAYMRFELIGANIIGEHRIELQCADNDEIPLFNNLFLTGEFSVEIVSSHDKHKLYRDYYNMKLYLPSTVAITLSKRGQKLKVGCWTGQGHPFYSGGVTYLCDVEVPQPDSDAILVLPKVAATCSVKCNGIELGTTIWAPRQLKLPLIAGTNSLKITVHNSLANMLEDYCATSGIIVQPFIMYT
ncbi:MAG: hypothetical protein L3J71_15975 [Victivallaceae bacterium]|nr:hypothetical protein [Victivallaceae bacterium]